MANGQNLAAIDIIETKTVSVRLVEGGGKNAAGKYEGIFHYVIENKWWKNVRNRPFHYVYEKKGSWSRLSIIFMKRNIVIRNEGSERPFDRCSPTWALKAFESWSGRAALLWLNLFFRVTRLV